MQRHDSMNWKSARDRVDRVVPKYYQELQAARIRSRTDQAMADHFDEKGS